MHRRVDPGTSWNGHERIDIFFEVVGEWGGEPVNDEPHKCDELRWVALDALPKNTVPEVAFALQKIDANEPYSNYNFYTSKNRR